MTSNQNALGALFDNSGLDDDAVAGLNLTATNLGPNIMAGLGSVTIGDVNDMGATEVMLLKLVIDDSSSINYAKNTDLVIEGHNLVLDALNGSKAAGAILVSCETLNHGPLYPFVTLPNATRMSRSNFNPTGSTPLFDVAGSALGSMVAKMSEFESGGVAVRGVTYFITDGGDYGSKHHTARSIEPIVRGLLLTESHIVGGMGIDDGHTDFKAVFKSMGILDQWILTPGNTPGEIRQAFGTISQSAVRASQAAGSFSQTAMGGF
jgi:hypothetical protein